MGTDDGSEVQVREAMSVTLNFPPETEKRLRERAAQSGQSVERLIQQLVEREVLGLNSGQKVTPTSTEAAASQAGMTLDQILAPVREDFERSGLTDDDLASLVEEVREKIWQEKQTRKVP
jgi:hypothetical protein